VCNIREMCVVVVLQGLHETFPLIVLHGRDEFFGRETLPVECRSGVVCGIDVQAKGTWCGVNADTGCAVFLTNYRTLDVELLQGQSALRSRGLLVLDLLNMKKVDDIKAYGLCNLLVMNVFEPLSGILFENNALGERRTLKCNDVHALSNSVSVVVVCLLAF
jgi:hypothetical protein